VVIEDLHRNKSTKRFDVDVLEDGVEEFDRQFK
jgi:hypothetical protein